MSKWPMKAAADMSVTCARFHPKFIRFQQQCAGGGLQCDYSIIAHYCCCNETAHVQCAVIDIVQVSRTRSPMVLASATLGPKTKTQAPATPSTVPNTSPPEMGFLSNSAPIARICKAQSHIDHDEWKLAAKRRSWHRPSAELCSMGVLATAHQRRKGRKQVPVNAGRVLDAPDPGGRAQRQERSRQQPLPRHAPRPPLQLCARHMSWIN